MKIKERSEKVGAGSFTVMELRQGGFMQTRRNSAPHAETTVLTEKP
jgi:hypothetical protein